MSLRTILRDALVFIALGLVALLVWQFIDKAFYRAQTVTISQVQRLCYARLEPKGKGSVFRVRLTALTADCDGLLQKVKTDPEFHGFRVIEDSYLSFDYESPADNQRHSGRLRRWANDQGAKAKVGDQITIYASILSSENYTDWSSAGPN